MVKAFPRWAGRQREEPRRPGNMREVMAAPVNFFRQGAAEA
jgi:hypothetical protein